MFDAFIKVDGIPGESTDSKHKDWIEVLSFHHGLKQPGSATKSSAGGGTVGRVELDDYVIVKHIDKASPKLAEACASGKHIKKIDIEFCRAGGDKVKYLEVNMEEVIISSVSVGGSAKSDEFPTEEISIQIGKIKWTYTQQKRADGSGGGNVSAGWDATANKTFA